MDSLTAAFPLPFLEIVWIDILLSGDNAIVIALACRSLPEAQRIAGIILGSFAAIALRVAFTAGVVELLGLPLIKIAGGGLLFWIAIKLACTQEPKKEIPAANHLWSAIRIIVLADAVMSLDNMLAVAAAAKGSILLILFGLALSIPLLISGSSILLSLIARFPIFVWAGAALLGFIAGEMIGSDPALAAWLLARVPSSGTWDGPLGAAFTLAVAWLLRHRTGAAKPP
jgi:YjbE family integral membrane protein